MVSRPEFQGSGDSAMRQGGQLSFVASKTGWRARRRNFVGKTPHGQPTPEDGVVELHRLDIGARVNRRQISAFERRCPGDVWQSVDKSAVSHGSYAPSVVRGEARLTLKSLACHSHFAFRP